MSPLSGVKSATKEGGSIKDNFFIEPGVPQRFGDWRIALLIGVFWALLIGVVGRCGGWAGRGGAARADGTGADETHSLARRFRDDTAVYISPYAAFNSDSCSETEHKLKNTIF